MYVVQSVDTVSMQRLHSFNAKPLLHHRNFSVYSPLPFVGCGSLW